MKITITNDADHRNKTVPVIRIPDIAEQFT